jgi:hypothetical protein
MLKKSLAEQYNDQVISPTHKYKVHEFLNSAIMELTGISYQDVSAFGDSFDYERSNSGGVHPTKAVTMIGKVKLEHFKFLCESVIEEGIPGDFIETGVWRGGACILAALLLQRYGITDRNVWVCDSFAGLPPPNLEKYPDDAGDIHHTLPHLAVSLEEVASYFRDYGVLNNQVWFVKGWFSETLPTIPAEKFSILRLDGDMYESTMDALNNLYPKLSDGGYTIIDDYGLQPCIKAVADFRKENNITSELLPVGNYGDCVYWKK